MVAPLIVGAARVVAGGSKILKPAVRGGRRNGKTRTQVAKNARSRASNGTKTLGNGRPQTKAQITKDIIDQAKIDLLDDLERMSAKEEENFLRYMEENLDLIQYSYIQGGQKGSVLGSALKAYKTFKAARASWFIFGTAIAFSMPQLTFWIFSLIGLAAESTYVVGLLTPGYSLFMLSYTLIITIGIITMIYALLVYSFCLVNWFGGFKFLVFALCIAFYCTPILNGPPWFILWLWVVTKNQGKEASNEEGVDE